MLHCCICGKKIVTEVPKRYFCYKCYEEWKEQILGKEDWVRICINDEHRQRRQALKDMNMVYLGNEFDISEVNGEYRLVPTTEYFEE